MLPGQMSTWDLKSVLDVPRYLLLKFGENRVSKSWDIRWGFLFFLLLSLLLGKVMPTLVQLELNCRLELSLAIFYTLFLNKGTLSIQNAVRRKKDFIHYKDPLYRSCPPLWKRDIIMSTVKWIIVSCVTEELQLSATLAHTWYENM